MRRLLLPLLVLINLALLGMLLSLWLTRDGRIRPVHWQPPEPLAVTLDGRVRVPHTGVDLARYAATLERPLFAPSRRPPPPPQPQKVTEVMPTVRVLAIYGALAPSGAASAAAAGAGAIARVDGAVRRLRVGDRIGNWSVEQIGRAEVVLSQGSERQSFALHRGKADDDSGVPKSAASASVGAGNPSVSSRPALDAARREAIAQIRAMNARRARSGLPPLPEP